MLQNGYVVRYVTRTCDFKMAKRIATFIVTLPNHTICECKQSVNTTVPVGFAQTDLSIINYSSNVLRMHH